MDWHREKYVKDDPVKWAKGKNPCLYQKSSDDWRLTTGERKRILLNNIYGVDIDHQTVEVTKLSLLLKVLEGEDEETIQRQLSLFQQRALPDLGNNIKCGNSLIGSDFYDGQLNLFDDEEMYRINSFDWENEFSDIMKNGGFDAVIGNPPYVRQEGLSDSKPYLQKHFSVYNGVADLYIYFIQKGFSLLKEEGFFSYIVANKWLRANYGKPIRLWLKERHIQEIIDFGALRVFQRATTYPCIITLQKNAPAPDFRVTIMKSLDFSDLQAHVHKNHYKVRRDSLDKSDWSLVPKAEQGLLEKLRNKGVPLGEHVNGKIYYGIKTGFNRAFVIDEATRNKLVAEDPKSDEIIKPFLAGRDIKRYKPPYSDKYVLFTRRGIAIGKYVAIKKYLSQFKERLMPRPKGWKGEKWHGRKPGSYQWHEIQDTVDYYAEFEKPKILWPGISAEVAAFAFDGSGYYGNDNNQMIVSSDKYLLGVLNSKTMRFFLTHICDKVQGGFYRLKIIYIQQLPIRTINFNDPTDVALHEKMGCLVNQILDLNKQLTNSTLPQTQTLTERQIEATDRQIDKLVYKLYDLTDEEIKIVGASMD